MQAPLDYHIVKKTWGEELLGGLIKRYPSLKNDLGWDPDRLGIAKQKSRQVYELTNQLKLFKPLGLVKYVGISGSIAAGTYKPGDDIDLFIIVKDHTSWFYRGLLKVLLGDNARLVEDRDIGDKLCINFICEERGLSFEDSIFTLHEFLHLEDIYNKEYRGKEFASFNQWLSEYGVEGIGEDKANTRRSLSSVLWWPINVAAFLAQVGFMKYKGHTPEVKRYFKALKKGRIAFYPQEFHGERLQDYQRQWEKLAQELNLPASTASTTGSTSTESTASTKTTR